MEQEELNHNCIDSILNTLHKLQDNKPDDRSELARRYAITITELEKVYAYFLTWVIEGDINE